MSLKLAAGLIAGLCTQLAGSELPAPWNLVLGTLAVAAAYVADHASIAAKLKGEPKT